MIKILLLLPFLLMCVTAIFVWTKVLLVLLGLDRYSVHSKDSEKYKNAKGPKTSMLSYDDLKIMCIKPSMYHQGPQEPIN